MVALNVRMTLEWPWLEGRGRPCLGCLRPGLGGSARWRPASGRARVGYRARGTHAGPGGGEKQVSVGMWGLEVPSFSRGLRFRPRVGRQVRWLRPQVGFHGGWLGLGKGSYTAPNHPGTPACLCPPRGLGVVGSRQPLPHQCRPRPSRPPPSAEAGGSKRPEQDPVPDPGLGARLPERAQVQGGPGHVPDHEGGR